MDKEVNGGARPRRGALVLEWTDTAARLKNRDLRDVGARLGGTEIRVAEKFW
jgi:hypothetical protein